VSAYSSKKQKDAAKDQYKYQQGELDRQRQYAEEMYRRRQNTPSARASSYLMEYYLPQIVNKMKKNSKGGDTSVLDRMLADIMGGIKSSNNNSNSSYMSNSVLTANGERIPRQMRSDGSFGPANTTTGKGQVGYIMGKVNPELEDAGYNGKTWNSGLERAGVESNFGSVWGTPAGAVGGPRESTRSMGNTTTQTERGYSNEVHAQGGLQASQTIPFQQGDLATGGQMQVATSGMDPQKLMLMGSMLGITNGPKGTTMGPNGTYGNGQFEWSDVMDWARSHPILWGIGKTIGNTIAPGLPQIGTAVLNFRDRRAARKNQQTQSPVRVT
jgi:hypothetical protein